MWVLGKIRESVENIPLEVSRYIGKAEEDFNLHNNVLTPNKIPEFCLPPQLCRRSPLAEAETAPARLHRHNQIPKSSPCANTTNIKTKGPKTKVGDSSLVRGAAKKHLPFSADGYGLAGIYESPNTRRKESLFHSKLPVYVLNRRAPVAAPKLEKETNPTKKTLSGYCPVFSSKSPSEAEGTESETASSSDSSPLSSPYSTKSSFYIPSGCGRLKAATSCPHLDGTREEEGWMKRDFLSVPTFPSSVPSSVGSSLTLAPPVLFPLDVLQCQERLQREHVLPLQGRGKVRLSAESTTFSTNTLASLSTVRVRLVSVEGLQDVARRQTVNCAVSLCLTPGRLQQQKSATIRNCCSLVFNEDFFFTELSREDLLELQLRLKVVDKAAAGTLRRGTVIGVITKPLSQLLHLNKRCFGEGL